MKPLTIMSGPFHHLIHRSNKQWVKKNIKAENIHKKNRAQLNKLFKYLTKKKITQPKQLNKQS